MIKIVLIVILAGVGDPLYFRDWETLDECEDAKPIVITSVMHERKMLDESKIFARCAEEMDL